MKQPKIERALEYLDDQYIREACGYEVDEPATPAEPEPIQPPVRRRTRAVSRVAWIAAAASFVLVLGGVFLALRLGREEPVPPPPPTVIAFDVNPSLELQIDSDRTVIETHALNTDAEVVLADTNLVGLPLDTAVDNLVVALLHHGYINAEHNTILVSVDGDEISADDLQAELSARITEQLKVQEIDASVITQTYDRTETAAPLPEKQEISAAKAALIRKIQAAVLPGTENMTYEELAAMSLDDLNAIILQNPHLLVDGLDAMNRLYDNLLPPEDALQAVLRSAQVKKSEVSDLAIDLYRLKAHDICVYVIQFATEENAYRYQIVGGEKTAGTLCAPGDIIERRMAPLSDSATLWSSASIRDSFLHRDEVWQCVREIAGIGVGEQISFTMTLTVGTKGHPAYTVTFVRGDARESILLDAQTGQLLHRTIMQPGKY